MHHITSPLSISWHHLSKKGHDFKTMLTYVGFDWDLPSHLVSLSNAKHLCLLSKINSTTSLPLFQKNMKQLVLIHGSLQHITLVYQQGCSHLPAPSLLLSKFLNDHIVLQSTCSRWIWAEYMHPSGSEDCGE